MVVVSDTSPLNYLILIDHIDLLPRLFGTVRVPNAVVAELRSPGTPQRVLEWTSVLPNWLIRTPVAVAIEDQEMSKLGAGERESIALASRCGVQALLLIDEGRGRRVADRLQVRYMGILGVLDRAASLGLVNLPEAIDRLLGTNFYVSPNLLKSVLDHNSGRRH